ncbi:MAG: hypothetical protein WDA20_09345 [Desulfuromonadales bacterium]
MIISCPLCSYSKQADPPAGLITVNCPKCKHKFQIDTNQPPQEDFFIQEDVAKKINEAEEKLTKCPECSNNISKKAVSCPQCGFPLGIPNTGGSEEKQAPQMDNLCLECSNPIPDAMSISCPSCGVGAPLDGNDVLKTNSKEYYPLGTNNETPLFPQTNSINQGEMNAPKLYLVSIAIIVLVIILAAFFIIKREKNNQKIINSLFAEAGMNLSYGNYNDAVGLYFKILELKPNKKLQGRIHNNIGMALLQTQDFETAVKAFSKGCDLGSTEACERMRQLRAYRY